MQEPRNPKNQKKPAMNYGIYILFAIILFGSFFFLQNLFKPNTPDSLTPSEFETKLNAGEFSGMTIKYSPIGGEDANTYKVTISDNDGVEYQFEIFMPALNDIINQIEPTDNITLTYVEKINHNHLDRIDQHHIPSCVSHHPSGDFIPFNGWRWQQQSL